MSTPSTGEGDGALRGLVKLLLEPRSGGAASALAGVKSMSIEASVSAVPWHSCVDFLLRCLPQEETNPERNASPRVDLPGFYPAVYPGFAPGLPLSDQH